MRRRPDNRARGFLSRGALLSLLVHANVLAPLAIAAWVYGGREEAQRAEEVDVGFEDASAADLPKDLPPIESPPPDVLQPLPPEKMKPEERKKRELAKLDREKEKEKKKKEPDQKKPELKPQPQVMVPPTPPPPPPPPKPPEPKSHEKMVDLDNGKEVEPPPDAKYLAQKNNRAEVETRATDTNLEKNQKGEGAASAPSKREDAEPGGEKQKIAELDDRKSALGRSAPAVTPHVNPELAAPKEREQAERKSLLSLRDPAPRKHELTPETADLSLPRQADGEIALPERAVRGKKSDAARLPPGKRVKLAITGEDYEYMFGADAEAERRLASKQRSMKVGRHLAKLAHAQSPLENFIPEVKVGNQTALNTRAAPFAAYIARMHRSIHKLWGFGQLEDWDEKAGSNPVNNPALMTELEIILNRDGTIDKVGIVRSSGLGEFDNAAMDTAYSAGPYPDPPNEIRSGNGKIYVHWRFYRDERQCATSGVDYFILDNAPKGGDDPNAPIAAAPTGPTPSPPSPTASPASAPASSPASPGSSTTANGGLRRLRRFDGDRHRAGMARLDEEVAAAETHDGSGPPAPAGEPSPASSPSAARDADPVARLAAERWFSALASGDIKSLANMAALPFRTSGKEVAKRAVLEAMLADLVKEGAGAGGSVQVMTAAGLRAAIGRLPPNLEDGGGAQLYAVAGSANTPDSLVLILAQRGGLWRAAGLVRR